MARAHQLTLPQISSPHPTHVCGSGGIRSLRVAGGSAMPDLITVAPCITTMVIGEKYTDMMKEDAKG